MPPRYTYWTIILEGKPTAFRARTEEELLPTLKQLQARHPDAVLKWFSRGKLWHSQEEERLARAARDASREKRGRDWRPGGTHRDPRERFQIPRDERRRRFRERLIRDRSQMPPQPPGEPQPPSENDQDRRPAPRRQPSAAEGKRPWKPSSERKGPWKPSREGEGKRPWKPKEQRPWKPAGPGGRPPGPGSRPPGPGSRPPRRSFGGPGKPGGGRRGGGGGGGQGGPRGGGRGGGGRGGGGRGGGPR